MSKNNSSLYIFLICLICQATYASEQIATLTQLQGGVKIFSHPSKTLQANGDGPRALYEGEYFLVKDANVGDQIEKGNILRTAPGAKARVVYPNGDQINVGPGSAYRVTWEKDAGKGKTEIQLAYGKIRGIVEKGGPRGMLRVKTKTAVMGVRGTDFFIAQGGKDEKTEVSIIRGSVEVTPQVAPPKVDKKGAADPVVATAPKPIEIKAGYSAEIAPPPKQIPALSEKGAERKVASALPVQPSVELRKTTQEELTGIQKSSKITVNTEDPTKDQRTAVPDETKKLVENLEKKATLTTLNDIKTHDKKLFAALEKQEVKTVDDINQVAVQTLAKDAPKAPPAHKPFKSELEDVEDGAYDRYFKVIE